MRILQAAERGSSSSIRSSGGERNQHLWIFLKVLKNLAHDGVGQDVLNLRVSHRALLSLLHFLLAELPAVHSVHLLDAVLHALQATAMRSSGASLVRVRTLIRE